MEEKVSNCCGAWETEDGVCRLCGEPCDFITLEEKYED